MTSVARANDGRVVLQSKGTVRFFDALALNEAVAAAVEGDTIDLADGTFYNTYGLTIDKKILLRGKSADKLAGTPYTNVNNDVTITSTCQVEGIYFSSSVKVTKSSPGLRFTSCSFYDLTFSADMPGMTIERCWIRNNMCLDNLTSKDINVNNCIIHYMYGGNYESRPCTFRNCNIANAYSFGDSSNRTFVDKMINCILEANYCKSNDIWGVLNSNVAANCLRNVNWGFTFSGTMYYFDSNDGKDMLFTNPSRGTCSYTKEELIERGYLGTDGTVVGIEGGAYPYTLTPLNTQITTSVLTVDETTKKVTVDVEVNVK